MLASLEAFLVLNTEFRATGVARKHQLTHRKNKVEEEEEILDGSDGCSSHPAYQRIFPQHRWLEQEEGLTHNLRSWNSQVDV